VLVEVEGAALDVERTPGGGSRGPAIVLLHEGLGSIAAWRDFPSALSRAAGREVVVYSRSGYGDSPAAAERFGVDFMHREAEVLHRLLDRLELDRPLLFGHSDGASIALIFAGRNPQRASGLILEAPHLFVEETTVRGIAAIAARYPVDARLRESLGRQHAAPDATFARWSTIWLDPAFRSWNIEASLASIAVPVLAIQGRKDEYGTAAQIDALAARLPAFEIAWLDGCGHAPHREQPGTVLDRVAAFAAAKVVQP
jgi:pimeloyl-ACP methyl ester carboxylesterase